MIMPQVGFTDMSDENQSAAFEICREAYSKYFIFLVALKLINSWSDNPWWNKLPKTSVCHLEMKHDSELKYFKDMALFIKKAMEEKFEDSWHVIVGTNFGSFVSYEHKCICLFWLEHIGFLLFKHGWVI